MLNSKKNETPDHDDSLKEMVRQRKIAIERWILSEVLRQTNGNKAEAARLLKIHYSTIHYKIKRYGIKI